MRTQDNMESRFDRLQEDMNALRKEMNTLYPVLRATQAESLETNALLETLVKKIDHFHGAFVHSIAQRRKRGIEKWNPTRHGGRDEAQLLLHTWIATYTEALLPSRQKEQDVYYALTAQMPVVVYGHLHVSLPGLCEWLKEAQSTPSMTVQRLRQLLRHDGWIATTLSACDPQNVYMRTQKRYWKQRMPWLAPA